MVWALHAKHALERTAQWLSVRFACRNVLYTLNAGILMTGC